MKKYMLLGNCQTGPVSSLMSSTRAFAEAYSLFPMPLIHTADQKTLTDASLIGNVDLIISQQLHNEAFGVFNTRVLSGLCAKQKVDLIIMSNPYFRGYYPFAIHMREVKPETHNIPISQDAIIFASFCAGRSVDAACALWDRLAVSPALVDFARQTCTESLREFARRERHQPSTFAVLGYFLKNYRARRLMHSLNHPTNLLYKRIAETYLQRLGIAEEVVMPGREIQGGVTYPIMPAVRRALRLTFDGDEAFVVQGAKKSLPEYAATLYAFYAKHPQIVATNAQVFAGMRDTVARLAACL